FWSHNNLGEALLKLERWSEAAEAYQNAIAWRDDLPWSHYNLAEALVKLERWEAAVKAYKRAMEIQPDLPCIYEKLGDALRHQVPPNLEEISQAYYNAIEVNPNNLEVYYKALEVNPKDAQMSLKLADAFRSQGQLDQAVTFYKNTLQLTPEDVDIQVLALHRLGSISQNRGHLEEALGLYRRCWELSPGVDSGLALAEVLEKLGRWSEALDQYRQVVLEFGECGPASLGLGRALAELKRPLEAVVEWRRAVKLGVETPEVHRLLAETLVELGRWSEVLDHWKWLLERYPGAAHWRRRLALALMGLGRWTEAAAQWGEYWRVAPGSGRCRVVDFRPRKKTHGEIDHSQELSITGDLTVEFWLYLRDWPKSWTDIIAKKESVERNEFCFLLKNGRAGKWYYGGGEELENPVSWVPQEDMRLHEWVHVACVRKVGEYGRIYFNGVLRREADWSGESEAVGTEAPVRLMVHSNGKRFHDGKLSEVRLWNRALSGDEIREGMCEGLTGEEPGLVGLWHGDESDEGVLVDAVGHHHGRLVMAADAGKERPRVGVCGWELSHNAAGRAYTLAQLYGGFAEVELIGCLFPKYGGQVWEPIRGGEIRCHTIRVENEGRFIEQALGLVLAHPYEVVHLSKPRMPNIILGLLYKLVWGARVIVDIDDEELIFVRASEPVDLRELLESGERLPKWKHLQGKEWTRIAVGLVREFDGVTVSNRALQERYGGVVIRHARDEARFVPSADLKRRSRERFGIAQDKKVVLFFGTPRKHKGLVTTARALASLGRKDVVFAIIGDFEDGKLKEELQGIPGVDYVFVGNQPFESIPDVVAVGDICVLLQDADFRVSQFQIPAKLSDALGMGLVVLLSETAAVADVIESGAVVPVAEGDLPAVLDRVLSDEAECNKFRVRGRELLAAEFGFGVNGSRLAEVMDEVRSGVGVFSDELNLLLAGFPAVGSVWSGLRDDKTKLQMVKTDDDSDIYSVYHRLGEALEELGRFDEAGEAYRRAIELQPESAGSVLGLSRVLGRLGKLDEAEKLYPHLAEKLYPHLKDKKIIVYTCNFGNYESVKEPLVIDPRIEYILFTDRTDIQSQNWKVIEFSETAQNPRRTSRFAKILAHKYLPKHDISVYIDSTMEIKETDVFKMVNDCLNDKDIALYKHYIRKCTYDEILYCQQKEIEVPEICDMVDKKYKSSNFPADYGLFENGFIIRKNTKKVRELNEAWWKEYEEGSQRDQFSLMYCLWKLNIKVSPITIGQQMRINPFINFKKHKYKSYINFQKKLSKASGDAANKSSNGIPKINWVIGGDISRGWAYDNNAQRLISHIRDYNHQTNGTEKTECAVFFDVLIHSKSSIKAETSIVRIGGPRPLKRLYGDDEKLMYEGLQNFTALICLNQELKKKLEKYHANVFLIPNGVDLKEFNPSVLTHIKEKNHQFVVGFAGSVQSQEERQTKGIDYAIEACKKVGVSFLSVGRGSGQIKIPHENMIRDFYSKIDVLVHPVGPGREGSSNVIMEALALGIPVITTRYAGYHSELLENNKDAVICERDTDVIANAIQAIKSDLIFANTLSQNGRLFAEKHHDINLIADRYRQVISQSVKYAKAKFRLSFLPFWLPSYQFASSRLRCMYPSNLLSESGNNIGAIPVYNEKSNVVVVTQSCHDVIYQKLKSRNDVVVIYDVCDKYYTDEKIFPTFYGNVNTLTRFYELADIAKIIITPTANMKREIEKILPDKIVVEIPEVIDYIQEPLSLTTVKEKKVVWFGNPGRGNFDSIKWILDILKDSYNYEIIIISRKKAFKNYPDYYDCCVEWDLNSFSNVLRQASLCVLSHHESEFTKSPNRLVTAIAHGIPTIVYNSYSYAEILEKADCNYAIINDEVSLELALKYLSIHQNREDFINKTQKIVISEYGRFAVLQSYEKLIKSLI
ncbi:tetratricopeptide repeat protein, partial [Limnospira fusiformis KN01]|uniref:tetratricopeptide repeat protein n=1 Tax=Limnospira fusiformis TaxID=54297 RepID=UPI001CA67F6D